MLKFLAVATMAALTASLPRPDFTPGRVASSDSQIVCRSHYASESRAVSTQMKHEVYVRYFGDYRRGYRIDHLIPLEVGGANDEANLWPQPTAESFTKDDIENLVHYQVCFQHRPIVEAQGAFVRDWTTAGQWSPTQP